MIAVETESGQWARFVDQIAEFLRADVVDFNIDGTSVRGFRSPDSPALWIRDHSDVLRAARYLEADVQSAVDTFINMQASNGRVFDYVITAAEPGEPENWEKWVRVPVESDVEYRLVKAAFLAWQASGDDAWIEAALPALEQALEYTRTHPWRWDDAHDLVKRPYTVDTWDFDYTAGRVDWLNFQVTKDTIWGLSHADNSGFCEAAELLGNMLDATGQHEAATAWRQTAEGVRQRSNDLLFNGRFYTHFHKLTLASIDGVDEAAQLSLSNPMGINRGLATHAEAVAILQEYQRRRAKRDAFAEWFSIDPPFPDGTFGDEKLVAGAYINGGIMPLVGGELARAAFAHGFERYGYKTLCQYRDMIAESGETYLWYFPDGTPSSEETSTSPEATPTDGWGSSAMLYGFVEGLCGIVDRHHSFRQVQCAPRWIAAEEETATVELSYAASGASFGYKYRHELDAKIIYLSVQGTHCEVSLHVLLPDGARASAVRLNDRAIEFDHVEVEGSPYADAHIEVDSSADIEVHYDL